jgi:hypothetical protein
VDKFLLESHHHFHHVKHRKRKFYLEFIFKINFSTLSTSITTDNLGQSSAFPTLINTNDGFESRPKSMTVSSNQQENIPTIPMHPRSSTITTESMNSPFIF